jgi:putative ABC transport system substrate-binding protein
VKRRQFITLLVGGAAAWSLAARAQQGERMRRIGLLQGLAESDGSSLFHPGARHEKSPSRLY